jgi:hypothetical protein
MACTKTFLVQPQGEAGLFKKSPPYFVLPSDSEASLTSFGTASLRGDPSADTSGRQSREALGETGREETPRLTPRGDKKKGWLGATKKGLEGTKRKRSGR